MANLLFWLGPDKLCFGSDYAIWSPKWLIEKFMAFELPDDLKQEYHVDLTFEIKRKILGENIASPASMGSTSQPRRPSSAGTR
jgi:predicted TIM-barrel fold metal-dependent hydrolase